MYILRLDMLKHIKAAALDDQTGTDDTVWQGNEPAVKEHVNGHLTHWYDTDTEFRDILTWNVAVAYIATDRLFDGTDKLYICIVDAPAGTLLTNTAFFTETDDRNPKIVEIMCDLILFNVGSRLNPRNMPDLRIERKDDANNTLVKIQKGTITLNLPERVDVLADDPGQEAVYGQMEGINEETY